MTRLLPRDYLRLQQLRLLEWMEQQEGPRTTDGQAPPQRPALLASPNAPWTLTHGISLQAWQEDARDAWVAAGRRGTMKVVTGAGKTVLALAIAEQLQRTVDPGLRVAIIVPTVVLLDQWYRSLLAHSDLPAEMIGRLGGGHKEDFDSGRRVLIAVLASAYKLLPQAVAAADAGDHLLLVIDECHRAGAPEQRAVLETNCRYTLGLSATPERSDDSDGSSDDYDASPLGQALGGTVYELTVADAVRLGILPPFELQHYGLSLTEAERSGYENIGRQLRDLRSRLREFSGARRAGFGDGFLAWCRKVQGRGGELGVIAGRFVGLTSERKQLLYSAKARRTTTRLLLREAFAEREDSRVILFHESIDEVAALFEVLAADGLPVVMEHSRLPEAYRESSLGLFRAGIAQVIVSARSLIEGFDVPAADLGIVVASSSSPRQRVQSIGRLLRRHQDMSGKDKRARICLLYIRDTADELIYEKADWERLTGADRNRFFHWDPPAPPVERDAAPRKPLPLETEIDHSALRIGDPYPGAYEGAEYSCDTKGNITNDAGLVATNAIDVATAICRLKGAGRFRVTPRTQTILVRVPKEEGWTTLYGGQLAAPLGFDSRDVAPANGSPSAAVDADRLTAGAPYNGPTNPAEQLYFSRKRGGVIEKRSRGASAFATGRAADHLISVLDRLALERSRVSKFSINALRHAFYREDGRTFFIAALDDDLQFPMMDNANDST